jgi:chemotaxis regulatin CheY-phosphate phosphatase CheZ
MRRESRSQTQPAMGEREDGEMQASRTIEPDYQGEMQELLDAARGMAEGQFHRTVNVRARGIVGELAVYINQTIHNLRSLNPTVRTSSMEIPKVAKHLAEIIQTTEEATNRVLEQTEYLVEEQTKVEQQLSRMGEMLRHLGVAERLAEPLRCLDEAKELQRRSQGRAMDIMAAMEFQDLTTQKIQKLIGLVAEVESRLLQLLVMFRIEDAAAEGREPDPIVQTCATDEAALGQQDLVDELLKQFQGGKA